MIDLEEDNILRSIESGISRDIDYLTYETLWIDIEKVVWLRISPPYHNFTENKNWY